MQLSAQTPKKQLNGQLNHSKKNSNQKKKDEIKKDLNIITTLIFNYTI